MAKVKTTQASDKLSKPLKAQIIALIEKANIGTHKSIVKLEKQVLALSPKKAKGKPKAIRPKKKTSAKKLLSKLLKNPITLFKIQPTVI